MLKELVENQDDNGALTGVARFHYQLLWLGTYEDVCIHLATGRYESLRAGMTDHTKYYIVLTDTTSVPPFKGSSWIEVNGPNPLRIPDLAIELTIQALDKIGCPVA
jgi:hypothetical protein